jgi:hypothetical protein
LWWKGTPERMRPERYDPEKVRQLEEELGIGDEK